MFGLGITEVLIFLVVAALGLVVPIGIAIVLIVLLRKGDSRNTGASDTQLRDENERLREELARTKGL